MPLPTIALHDDGLAFSRLICGLWRLSDWQLSPQDRLRLIETCLDLGITTFDHADIYGDYSCEGLFGEALALHPGLRSQMLFVTKCDIKLISDKFPEHHIHHYDTSRSHIIASAEASLKHLRTDHLDVLLLHRPDPLMDADEVAEAFSALRSSGKVRHFGVSNFTPAQFDLLADRLPFPLVTNQVECSVLNFEVMHDGTLDHHQRLRVAPMVWSPLGGGRLFGSHDAKETRVRSALHAVAEEVGAPSIDQVAYAWLLRHPGRLMPILGTGRIDRIRAAVYALSLSLSRQQWFTIWRASTGHDVP